MRRVVHSISLAALALALMYSAAFGATPTISLSRTAGHPTIKTRVGGNEFGPREAIDIYLDTTDLLLVKADATGNFGPHGLRIPANAGPGTHWITAVGRTQGDAAQTTFIVSTRWTSHGFNHLGLRHNPYENVISASNVQHLQQTWTGTTGGDLFSSPAVANIRTGYNPYVFIGSLDNNLYAFDSTGTLKWRTMPTRHCYMLSSPAVAGGMVYVGCQDGHLFAFDARTGAMEWVASVGGIIESSPTVANGIVYVGSDAGKVVALHASDGTPAWASPATTGVIDESSPAVANGILYVGAEDFKLYALDAKTGLPAWSSPFPTGGDIGSSPAVADGVVFFGSADGNIYAVDAKTGLQRWVVTTGDRVTSSAAVANGVVYIGSEDGKLYTLNANNGAILWTGAIGSGGAYFSSATTANGVVYIGALDGNLYAFDANGCGAATCSPLWTAPLTNGTPSSPAISDGMVYIGGYDRNLHAFALNGGSNAAYKYRKNTHPPSYSSLHPDLRLKPVND